MLSCCLNIVLLHLLLSERAFEQTTNQRDDGKQTKIHIRAMTLLILAIAAVEFENNTMLLSRFKAYSQLLLSC